jgi:hypothetical protein
MESNRIRLKMTNKNETCSSTIKEESYFDFGPSDFNNIVKMEAFIDRTLQIKATFKEMSRF